MSAIMAQNFDAVKCNLTKLTTKSSTDWQHGYLPRAVVVNSVWPRRMLTWFLSHMTALVGDLAGFLVPLCSVGLQPHPPPLPIFPLFLSVTGAWTPGVGLMAALRGLRAVGVLIGPGAGWLASSGSPWTFQAPNLHFVM